MQSVVKPCGKKSCGTFFGLCDEISFYRTGYRLDLVGGGVETAGPERLRQVEGRCN